MVNNQQGTGMKRFNIFYKTCIAIFSISAMLSISYAAEDNLPEAFRGYQQDSKFIINYDDLNLILKNSVLVMGKSTRRLAQSASSNIGTRFKNRVNRLTANEGNRFYFEGFRKPEQQIILTKIRHSLEKLPSDAPLHFFSKEEQLAYWLNLYNVTMLEQLVKIYPRSSLKDELTDSDGILNQKLLTVAGVKLSLNDIEYKILMEKYNHDPLIIYGLYQGNIGGPNIRNQAYTGKNVYRSLENNANEFINSNRGTYGNDKKYFRVSGFYKRNSAYFPNFKKDLTKHLLTYIDGYTRRDLKNAHRIKANINDWKFTDLYGSMRKFGVGASTNKAALMSAVSNPIKGGGREGTMSGVGVADTELVSNNILARTPDFGRFSQEQTALIKQLVKNKRINTGQVTVTDLPDTKNDKSKDNK